MNTYIEAQIDNMTAFIKTFEQSCTMAATKDDGRISKDEQKLLKGIKNASRRYIASLNKLKK